MLISPAEPLPLRQIGTVSSLPEKWGCDILIRNNTGDWAGVQRKAIPDLIASVHDGRLSKELMQMASCDRLLVKILVIEGEPKWTNDGSLMTNGYGKPWLLSQHRGLLWSARLEGLWVDATTSLSSTIQWLSMFDSWWNKSKHQSLHRRPNAKGPWGTPDSTEFNCHLLMGIPQIGPELAKRIVEHFGGLPWAWTVTEKELMEVKGVGKKLAGDMMKALRQKVSTS